MIEQGVNTSQMTVSQLERKFVKVYTKLIKNN